LSAPPTIREDEEWVDLRTSHNVETPEELHKRLWGELHKRLWTLPTKFLLQKKLKTHK